MAATIAPTRAGSSLASGARRSTHWYAGGVGRLLELGRRAHLVLTGLVERHLHRPAAICRVQPPHKPLLTPRDRPVRQPRLLAQAEAPGELYGIHPATPAHI